MKQPMRSLLGVLLLMGVGTSAWAVEPDQGRMPERFGDRPGMTGEPAGGPAFAARMNQATVEQILDDWQGKPRRVAQRLIAKYGLPQEATTERLIWHNNGPWKHTEVVNEEIEHLFPKPHKDMLFQAINYNVPPEKFDDLALYDGSVIAERTKGELAARCDKEEANFLALNLADDIVKGRKTVQEARKFYSDVMAGKVTDPSYTQGFRFQVTRVAVGDPDQEFTGGMAARRTIIGEVLRIEGDHYIIKDPFGREVALRVDPDTMVTESFTVGDEIEAEVVGTQAKSIRKITDEGMTREDPHSIPER